jgi:hypothetical protein
MGKTNGLSSKFLILAVLVLLYGCGDFETSPTGTEPLNGIGTLHGRIITDAGTQLSQATWWEKIFALVFTFIYPAEARINTSNTVGVPGLLVLLLDERNNEVATTVTWQNGEFVFMGIPFGDFIVRVLQASKNIDFQFGVNITPNKPDHTILCKIEKINGEKNVIGEVNGIPVTIHNNLTGSPFSLPIPAPAVATPTPQTVLSTPTPSARLEPTPTPNRSELTPTPTPSATPTPDMTPTPTPTPSATPTPDMTPTPTPTPSATPTPDMTPTPTPTPSATPTPDMTPTPTPIPSATPTPNLTPTPTPTMTPPLKRISTGNQQNK